MKVEITLAYMMKILANPGSFFAETCPPTTLSI